MLVDLLCEMPWTVSGLVGPYLERVTSVAEHPPPPPLAWTVLVHIGARSCVDQPRVVVGQPSLASMGPTA